MEGAFDRNPHVMFFARMLQGLPYLYQEQDSNRLTLAYFAISALDILDALDQVPCSEVVDWVYSLQILHSKDDEINDDLKFGFCGAPLKTAEGNLSPYDGGHLAATYSALAILRILGDYSRVCKTSILHSVRLLQQPDGCFTSIHTGTETDLRFIFCAAAICTFLEDWRGMDISSAFGYIIRCQSYDGGFGLCPGLESHVASLKLMLASGVVPLNFDFSTVENWCIQRQEVWGGFQGRINKLADTCYAFWIGASLHLLDSYEKCDRKELRDSLIRCQDKKNGGFSKYSGLPQDALHSYYGVCGLSLLNEPGLNALRCELGISDRAAKRLTCAIT